LDVFRTEAEDFDAKAQNIRSAQDAKERALEDTLAQGRDQFFEVTRPILGQLMVDRGAFAILDRRSVILSLGSIDVTEEAIARIDALIGEGTAATLGTDDNLYPDTEVEN
jgi:Skp family chaperone for outer membrane proteins